MRAPIDGSVALVTGASAGIGLALARELAPRVRTLILVARRVDKLESLQRELKSHGGLTVQIERCDLTDRKDLDSLIERITAAHGGVDILINNAGRGDFRIFDLSSWAAQEELIELNVRAPAYLIQRLSQHMVKRGRGGILNISSGIAFAPLFPGMGSYAASKHFLNALSESVRLELAPAGVVVTCACPGPVQSEFMDVAGAGAGDRPPSFLVQSAADCARDCIAGFERNQALVMPGLMNRISSWLTRMTPRFVMRLALSSLARSQRRKQSELRLAPGE